MTTTSKSTNERELGRNVNKFHHIFIRINKNGDYYNVIGNITPKNVSNYIVKLAALKASVITTLSILLSTKVLRNEIILKDFQQDMIDIFAQIIDFQSVYPITKMLESMIKEFSL